MKKLFLAMAAIAVFAFVGCSKDDGGVTPSTENIAGTWEVYKIYEEYDGEKAVDTEWGVQYGFRWLLKLNKDNSFEEIMMEEYNGTWDTDTESGTYKISGNTLQLTYVSGDVDEWIVEKLTASELVLLDEHQGYDEKDRLYFKRIE